MILLYLFSYFSILVFIFCVISKILKYSRTPIHVRWELYPVAHEKGRSNYGGSYYEDANFWKKSFKKNHFAELFEMFQEIFFLKGVFIHNRRLWYFSFPFHFGLYLILINFLLIVISAVIDIITVVDIFNLQNTTAYIFHILINISGYAGLALTFAGCIGLIVQRVTDEKFKFYNTPMDFANLIFILILIISISVTLVSSNSSFSISKLFVENLLTFNFIQTFNPIFIIHVVLICLFLMYFPITRMMHLFAKYFTYHKVRWEDEPNIKGGKLEKKIKEALNFGVSWSAPHMKTGKTWAEVATTVPSEEKK